MSVKVRITPSPNGNLEIGTAKTAVFNWLFAKSQGGQVILRIEDKDEMRSSPENIENIISGLKWLDLKWDEGPIFQSKRLDLYRQAIKTLLDKGLAYHCYCNTAELEAMQEEQKAKNEVPHYDNRHRNLTPEEQEKFVKEGRKAVIRLQIEGDQEISWHDLVKGKITIKGSDLGGDIVIADAANKNDIGQIQDNLAVVVDDIDMGISHVIRGEDHIENTAKEILIYEALGAGIPEFAHIPLILNEAGQKLSEADGMICISDYQKMGYIPEAMINYMIWLSWSPPDNKEKFSVKQAAAKFSFDRVSKSAVKLNLDNLNWLNGQYLHDLPVDKLTNLLIPCWQDAGYEFDATGDRTWLEAIAALIQEKLICLQDAVEITQGFFVENIPYEKEAANQLKKPEVNGYLKAVLAHIPSEEELTKTVAHKLIKQITKDQKAKKGSVTRSLRAALTGKMHGVDTVEYWILLHQKGWDKNRLQIAIDFKSSKVEIIEKETTETITTPTKPQIVEQPTSVEKNITEKPETMSEQNNQESEIFNANKAAEYTNALSLLEANIAEMEKKLKQADEEQKTLHSQLTDKENQVTEISQQKLELQNEVDKIKAELNQRNEEKCQMESQQESLQSELNQINSEKSQMQGELQTVYQQKSDIQAELDLVRSEKSQVEVKLQENQGELNRVNSEKHYLETELGRINQEKSHLHSQVQEIQGELDSVNHEKSQLDAQLKAIEGKLDNVNHEKSQLDAQLKETQAELERIKAEKSQVQVQLDETRHHLEDVSHQKGSLETELQDVKQARSLLESQIAEQSQHIIHLDNELKKVQHDRNHLQQQLEEIDQSRRHLEARVSHLESDIESSLQQRLQTTERLSEVETQLQREQQQRFQLQNELEQAKNERINVTNDLNKIQGELQQLQQEKGNLESQLEQAHQERSNLQSQLINTQSQLQQVEQERSIVKGELSQANNSRSQLQEQLSNTLRQVQELQTQGNQLEAKIEQLNTSVSSLQFQLSQSQSQIQQAQKERWQVQTDLEKYHQIEYNLQSQIKDLEAELQKAQAQQSNLQSQIEKSNTEQSQLQEQLSKLQLQTPLWRWGVLLALILGSSLTWVATNFAN